MKIYSESGLSPFRKYEGKNVWVKVTERSEEVLALQSPRGADYLGPEYYIKIYDIDYPVLHFDAIDATFVDDIEQCEYTDYAPSDEVIISDARLTVYDIEILTPIEVFTEAEMDERLDEMDQYWEDHHDHYQDGYDDEGEE